MAGKSLVLLGYLRLGLDLGYLTLECDTELAGRQGESGVDEVVVRGVGLPLCGNWPGARVPG